MLPVERLASASPDEDLFAALGKVDDANLAQIPVVAGRLLGNIGLSEQDRQAVAAS